MNIRAYVLLVLIFSLIVFPLCARQTVNKEYYTNGKLKAITKTRVTVPRNIDPFNFYKKTRIERHEFDSISGNLRKETVRTTMVGHSGKRCYEVYYKQIDYDDSGNRIKFQKSSCDKSKTKIKEYENGKITFIRIQKRRRILWW